MPVVRNGRGLQDLIGATMRTGRRVTGIAQMPRGGGEPVDLAGAGQGKAKAQAPDWRGRDGAAAGCLAPETLRVERPRVM